MIDLMAANLTATMSCFARAVPDGQIHELSGITLVDAGPANAIFNSALLTAPIDTERDLENCIHAAVRYFLRRGAGWSFWVCEGLLASPVRRRLESIFARHGMQLTATTPGLETSALKNSTRPMPSISLRRVGDDESRASFCHIMTMSFDGPSAQLMRIYGSSAIWETPFRGFIGSVDGTDVAAGATVSANGVTGLYAVGTLPAFRRQGYAEAVMRLAIEDTFKSEGNQPLVLQSTPIALRLYRRMGFRSLTSFSLYSAP